MTWIHKNVSSSTRLTSATRCSLSAGHKAPPLHRRRRSSTIPMSLFECVFKHKVSHEPCIIILKENHVAI
ncbi:hypothetical protein BDA96_02G061300 [Sorghum bicolor]|uniref:Uncharacterized protein n=2 Tax=Sorghum bicolor TaxID=4558 RepID=A0A921USV4_SORBI|nr:hypothetical protein BDA96_02G061300 [Sorghum bicolor]KXG34581.1 hypothetical protein SORBI_3002G061000 [Sorghum bicolor]